MYFNQFFNIIRLLMVAGIGLIFDDKRRIDIYNAAMIITLCSAIVARPYRDIGTNILLLVLSALFCIMGFQMQMKINGYNTDLFSDKYFHWLLIIQSGFFWVVLITLLILMACIGGKWPITKKWVQDHTLGQENAVIQIIKARKFKEMLLRNRHFGKE